MFQGARAILAQDGTKGLFRGMVPSLLTIVPYGGLSFMIYKGCLKLFAPVWSSSARSKWSEERVVAG